MSQAVSAGTSADSQTNQSPTVIDADTEGVVEAAGHFRIYLGAAAGVGKT